MKKLRFLTVCLMAVLTGLYFLSCSNNDDDYNNDDRKKNSSIIGTWVLSSSVDPDSGKVKDRVEKEYVMFCADGTFYEFEEDSYYGIYVEKMEYVYNEAKNSLVFFDTEYGDSYTTEVLSLTNDKMILESSSGYDKYEKTKSPYTQAQLEKLYQLRRSRSSSYK